MLLRGVHAAAAAPPAPAEEVKLAVQNAAHVCNEWARMIDVCRIVDAKAQLPGLLRNSRGLLNEVLRELEHKRPELEEQYRRTRISEQRALEKMVRERAATRRKASGDRRAAALPGAERELPPEDDRDHRWATAAETRKGQPPAGPTRAEKGWIGVPRHHMSDDGEAKLVEPRARTRQKLDLEAELQGAESERRRLLERGPPREPRPRPTVRAALPAWKDEERAYRKFAADRDGLQQRCDGLRAELRKIGLSGDELRTRVEEMLPSKAQWHRPCTLEGPVGVAKPMRRRTFKSRGPGAQPDQPPVHSARLCAADYGAGGQFSTLGPYFGLPESDPLAPYAGGALSTEEQKTRDYAALEQLAEHVKCSRADGRSQPQSAAAELRSLARAQPEQAVRLQAFRDKKLRATEVTQLNYRLDRQAQLEAEAQQQPEPKEGSKLWRLRAALKQKPQVVVTSAKLPAQLAAATADRYDTKIWVPGDGFHLARDVLDRLDPLKNGCPRSSNTSEAQHRKALDKQVNKGLQSCPVLIIVAALKPLGKNDYRKVLKLHGDCGIAVAVCDPGCKAVATAGGLDGFLKTRPAKKRKSADEKKAGRKAGWQKRKTGTAAAPAAANAGDKKDMVYRGGMWVLRGGEAAKVAEQDERQAALAAGRAGRELVQQQKLQEEAAAEAKAWSAQKAGLYEAAFEM